MNPLFQNNKGQDVNSPSNPLNESNKSYRQNKNKFIYDRPHATTASYADITPFECVEGVGDDTLEFGSRHHIASYTFGSRLFSELRMNKSYYMIDMRAILPENWEKIYKEPSKGSDVPSSGLVNTYINDLIQNLYILRNSFIEDTSSSDYTNSVALTNAFRLLILFEDIFSDGGLNARLYNHLSPLVSFTSSIYANLSFDKAIELLYSNLSDRVNEYANDGSAFLILGGSADMNQFSYGVGSDITFHEFLDIFRAAPVDCSLTYSGVSGIATSIVDDMMAFFSSMDLESHHLDDYNYSRLIAYQLICAQYFTNSKIDNIYTADLWHQNMYSLYQRAFLGSSVTAFSMPTFMYNGVLTLFDSVSGYVFQSVLLRLQSLFSQLSSVTDLLTVQLSNAFGYLFNIFHMNRSLRYGDYFMGARPEAYSPLNKSADVVDNAVNAVDITRSILAQRFSNAVARTNRTFSEYLGKVVDGYDVPDVHEPRWLATKISVVKGYEVENTASEQGDIVTILNNKQSNFIYRLDVGSPCIVIGVCYFSMQRFYGQSLDRFVFHKDRYDMYNKFFQYDGDQEIFASEYNAALSDDFAYTLRHMEYKQRFPVVSGGWREFLPAMFLIADKTKTLDYNSDTDTMRITEFNIRNLNLELDPFYKSLTGYGLAARFHFQIMFDNVCTAYRRMARTPSIL